MAKRIVDYLILRAYEEDLLEGLVKKALSVGWVLQGGICITNGKFLQAMVLEKEWEES